MSKGKFKSCAKIVAPFATNPYRLIDLEKRPLYTRGDLIIERSLDKNEEAKDEEARESFLVCSFEIVCLSISSSYVCVCCYSCSSFFSSTTIELFLLRLLLLSIAVVLSSLFPSENLPTLSKYKTFSLVLAPIFLGDSDFSVSHSISYSCLGMKCACVQQ